MAKQTTEAIITLNGKQPLEVLNQLHAASEKIKEAIEQVQAKMKDMSPKDDGYKQLNTTLKGLKEQYNLLSSAQVKDIEATQRLQSAVENLASTSLKNLRKAFGDGKRQIEGLSEAELAQADALRSLMKTVGDQVRLLEGKYVKIREGLASIGTQSDQWLSKAISQQQELMFTTRRGTSEYREQEKVMAQLAAEQDRRNAAIAAEATARRQAQFKQQVASSRQMLSSGDLSKYSSSDVQTSINTLKQAQSQTAMGSSEWKQFADEIKKAEAELDKLLGKTKEVKQQMSEGEAKSILGDVGSHTEQEVREAINALKLLQSTVNVGGNEWNAYAADIEKAETELGKLTGKTKEVKQQMSEGEAKSILGDIGSHTEQEVREAINALKLLQSTVNVGGNQWNAYAADIEKAETELGKLTGKTKEAKQQMSEGEAKSILGDIGSHTEQEVREAINALKLLQSTVNVGGNEWNAYAADIEKAETELGKLTGRIKEAKAGLSMNDVNSRMQSLNDQSEQSLKEMIDYLQKAKAELTPYSQEWKNVANQIDAVKQRMADVQANTPYVRNEAAAQAIARNNQMQMTDGTTHDVTRQDLQWSKDYLQKQLDVTPVADTAKIQQIQEALGLIDERMKALNGDTEKATMSADKLDDVLNNMKTASLSELRDASAALKKQLDGLAPSSGEAKKIKKQLQDLDREIKQVEDDVVDVNDVIARSKNGKASITELKQAYKQLEAELNRVDTGTKEFAEKHKDLENLRRKIDEVTVSAKKQGGAWQTALKNLTAYVGLFQVFNKIKDTITAAIKKNFEYSGSLTDIRKVSGLTMQDINQLSNELAKIDTRTSVDGLAQLAYQGAKLGVGKYGVDGMKQFVAAADKINVAIGEEMGDEALPALLKMTEVMGLIPKMGLEKSIEATGSAMFKLSSSSTATSNDIVEFAKRCTGVARTAGITTDQLLALGSAFSAQMASPEVAATAMSKFIVALQKNHNLIEKDLSIPDGTINNMYKAGDAMEAIVLILEKMKAKGNMNALGDIFKDVGGDGQRLISSMVTMAKNVDMLKDHLYDSQKAFEEATAVTSEYEMQQQSAIGILERANNLWEKAFVNPDGVDAVKDLAQWWYTMSANMTSSPILKGTLSVALTIILNLLKGIATLMPIIIGYIASQGLYSGLKLLGEFGSALKVAWTQMLAYLRITQSATVAQDALNKKMKLNPWVAIASVVIAAAGAIYGYVQQVRDAAKAEKEAERKANAWKNSLGEAAVETSNVTRKMENYKKMLKESNLSQEDKQKLVSRFNKDFRSYITNLGIEIKTVDDLTKNYTALAQEAQRATYYRYREQAKKQALPKYDADRNAASNELMKQVQRLGIDKLGVTFNDIDRWVSKGANGNAIFWYLVNKMPREKSGLFKGEKWSLDEKGFVYRKIYDGSKAGPNSDDKHMPYKMRDLLSAARWYANATNRRNNKEKEIEKSFINFVPEGYTDTPDDKPGTLDNLAGDETGGGKGGGKGGGTVTTEKKEVNQAKTRANALVANIKAFYEEQKRKYLEWVTTMNADGENVSEGQQKQMLEHLDTQMNTALGTAKKSIATLDGGWKDFLKQMPNDVMVKMDDTSKELLESMGKSDINELHALFEKLSSDLSKENHQTLSENLGALLDQIFANGSKELREAAERLLNQQREIQNILNENDYTGAVNRATRSNFDTLGLLNPAKAVKADTEGGLKTMNKAFDNLTEKARSSVAELYRLNPQSETFQQSFLQYLSVANEGFDFSVLNAQKLKALYFELIKYTDSYTEAEKREHDAAKKVIDQSWATQKRNLDQQEKIRKIQNEGNLFGKRTTFWSNLGLADPKADPEIVLMKARMQAAEDYYAFVKANTQNMQLIREADDARQQAELNYANQMATAMKSRLSQMKELVQPITDFGSAVGKALADMKNDAESANEAIKSALKSMLESWAQMALNDVNTQMWKAINDAGAKRGRDKAQPDIEVARKNADANAVKENLSDLGTPNNPMSVYVVNGQPVDANGNPVAAPLTPTGDIVTNPDGTKGLPPQTTNGDLDALTSQYNPFANQSRNSVVFKDAASQTGSSVADVATGGSTLAEAGAGLAISSATSLMNTEFKSDGKKNGNEDKKRKKQLEAEKKHQKEMSKEMKKGTKDREDATSKGMKNMTQSTEEGNKDQLKSTKVMQDASSAVIETGMNLNLENKKANDKEVVEQSKKTAEVENTFSIAGAIGKCFEYLGPIAGPIAAAVVMSTLTGIMQWALNKAFSSGSKSSSSSSSSSSKNTKLVSGMLTYDSGNVQDLKPFVGDNGEVYWAEDKQNVPQSGVNLLTTPTATTINGQRSLVAENGPEIVIGRETTKAMMMNNPALLKALVNYDRNYSGRSAQRRAYDNGNVGETLENIPSGVLATEGLIADSRAANLALLGAVNALLQRLNEPISAKIDMYGRGNLYDSMTKANQFMKGKA